jgi:hypothetical protein
VGATSASAKQLISESDIKKRTNYWKLKKQSDHGEQDLFTGISCKTGIPTVTAATTLLPIGFPLRLTASIRKSGSKFVRR